MTTTLKDLRKLRDSIEGDQPKALIVRSVLTWACDEMMVAIDDYSGNQARAFRAQCRMMETLDRYVRDHEGEQ